MLEYELCKLYVLGVHRRRSMNSIPSTSTAVARIAPEAIGMKGLVGLVVSGCFSCSDRVRNLHGLARNAVGKLGSWFGVAHGAQS